jgi:glycosyltransferase 2 family protein
VVRARPVHTPVIVNPGPAVNRRGPGYVFTGMRVPRTSGRWRRLGVRAARCAVPLVLIAVLAMRLGAAPFLRAGHVLTPGPIAAALLLGLVTTTAQALRWRTVARAFGSGAGLTRAGAIRECYRAALLNTALPGGLAGDAVRVWRRGADHQRAGDQRAGDQRAGDQRAGDRPRRIGPVLRSAAGSVVVERAVGTALLLLATATAALAVDRRLSAVALTLAVVASAVAGPGLTRLSGRARAAVLGWSLVAMTSLITKVTVAAVALGTVHDVASMLGLAVFLLAGGSVPVGFGGFGPRETAAAYAFAGLGLSAAAGVATSAAFGLLAVVSVLPGLPIMLLGSRRPGPDPQAAGEPVAPDGGRVG